jgi:DNA-binding helix-hairpin-helix protein with protein kinase domain
MALLGNVAQSEGSSWMVGLFRQQSEIEEQSFLEGFCVDQFTFPGRSSANNLRRIIDDLVHVKYAWDPFSPESRK